MTEALFIKRKKGAADEQSFEQLRRDGIGFAQQFSGRLWSDFNLHDPGVTILEQLCYALTDLIHRADLDVADYLADADGSLNFEQLALHRPENIFPPRPTTLEDYRQALLDEVAELDNLWLTPLRSGSSHGLYQVALKLAHGVMPEQHDAVIEKVRRYYNGVRNLCEEFATITVVKDDDYELCAEIEVASGRLPAEIVAEIYFECAHAVACCRQGDATAARSEFLVSSLFTIINGIAGVEQISNLHFEKGGRSYYDIIACNDAAMALNLQIPALSEETKVTLFTSGRRVPVSSNELRARFDELDFAYHSSRRAATRVIGSEPGNTEKPLPRGIPRPLNSYFSIQNQFPSAYGIGVHGVPGSAPAEVKARALQLKSYLLIFEQLMANYLANLGSIKQLFSSDRRRATYSGQPLDNSLIADFDRLFSGDAEEEINTLVAAFDNVDERKSRLLDYLLALYGESFPQHSLRHFNDYHDRHEADAVLIDNKIAYLESIVALGRDRAAAADYGAAPGSPQALSGLQQRVNLLLAFKPHEEGALTMPLLKHDLKLIAHDAYEKYMQENEGLPLLDMAVVDDDSRKSFERVQDLEQGMAQPDLNRIRDLIGHKRPLQQNPFSDLLLRNGIYLDRYRVGSLTAGLNYQLLFRLDDRRFWNLGSFADQGAAIAAAHGLRRFLIDLNAGSEGVHVVEHLLLRSQSRTLAARVAEEFYPFRISVIFPAWSARCHDPQFRLLAEETVMLNTPAHIHAQFYWLDFHEMYQFELLHEKWRELKRAGEAGEALDTAAVQLTHFLLKHSRGTTGRG